MWYEKYLGIPFVANTSSFDMCDCAGLVFLVINKELNLKIERNPDVDCNARNKHILMKQYFHLLREIPQANIQPLDIYFQAHGTCWHVGVVVDKNNVLEATYDYGVKLRNISALTGKKTTFYRVKR